MCFFHLQLFVVILFFEKLSKNAVVLAFKSPCNCTVLPLEACNFLFLEISLSWSPYVISKMLYIDGADIFESDLN